MSLILAIDDEHQILELLDAIFTYEGHRVRRASDGAQGLQRLTDEVDLVITDLIMPNKEGLETIAEIRRSGSTVPIVAMTAGGLVGPSDYLETARFIGANAVLAKPFARDEVLSVSRYLLSERSRVAAVN